jgi:hypothetical protein
VNRDDPLVERYEEIRWTFLDRSQAVTMWGLAVLRTKGMAAWARSWREYGEAGVKNVPPATPVSAASRLSPSTEEVVRVLAAMLWALQEETVP